jgi:hypothetical protein
MKQIRFLTSKALFTLALGLSLSTYTHAQTMTAGGELPGTIRYMGIKDRMLYFDVNIAALPARAVLRIVNENGEVLHEEYARGGNFNRRFVVPAGLCERLRFEVAGKGVQLKQAFDIARQMEERVVVTASL